MPVMSTPWLRAFPDYLLDVNRLCSRFGNSQLCLFLLQRLKARAQLAWERDQRMTNALRLNAINEALRTFQEALRTGIAEQD